MFFVLSGYLITGILLRELDERGRIDLLAFWGRRMQRLYPALVTICGVYALFILLAPSAAPPHAWGDLLNAITYTSNFGPFGAWGWLGHTWSLAVEEQFYLGWPLALTAGHMVAGRKGILAIAAIGAGLTMFARGVTAMPADDIDMLLRWDALLIGCALATVFPRQLEFRGRFALGAAAFATLAFCAVRVDSLPLDKYTITAWTAGAALLAAPRFRWLESDVLRYFGRISYSLYLWHVLILRFALPGPISLALSLIAAELSYRYVERRFWSPHGLPQHQTPRFAVK